MNPNPEKTVVDLGKIYDDGFYDDDDMAASYPSALRYIELLSPLYRPKSVVDVGCGRGIWLKAWKELGATKVVGLDGPWNSQDKMTDQSIVFYGVDLNKPIEGFESEKFDMAMTLEVAEHLEPPSASTFIESLTKLSDVVLFGAAYTKQGGTNHINEQPHTYWANIFTRLHYVPFDLFRQSVWGDTKIPFWYRQNTFLYVRTNSSVFKILTQAGKFPMAHIAFMDCVHPVLYEGKVKRLKELGQENRRLKRMYADLSLENTALKNIAAKK